ncbi:ABC transporter ATP-binding protein [Echinimonas agarilytica]|uniref:ABC transporter ATP-binding protein n=1 Tax=Echinimonas agarilytica TaxID=1215918 RepID=A0AA42B8A0_9GAMM|nr:ABC transporter ATP-binding protein [Echinimonas agarilytica]
MSKSYPGCIANDSVSLKVAPGEVHAILGENGAGKSTLMKMIYGVVKPDSGQMLWNNREVVIEGPAHARKLGMGMVFQHFSLFETLTVVENIALYLDPQDVGDMASLRQRIIDVGIEYGLDVNPDRCVATLSVGEQQRVEIIRCLLQDIQLLILDEPTAVLTPAEAEHLIVVLKQLASKGCSILFISHKLHEVNALCDRATVLRAGKVTGSCVPRNSSPSDMAKLMLGDELELKHDFAAGKRGEMALALKGVEVEPSDTFSIHLRDINLTLNAGEIVGLAGVAGNGQDELVDLINGELTPTSGDIRVPLGEIGNTSVQARRRMGLAVVPADRIARGSVATMNLSENNLLTGCVNHGVRGGLIDWKFVKQRAQDIIKRYAVKAIGPDDIASSLSGGNLQKFIIGREVEQSPNILVCFHPTWGVDVGAANLIHQQLIALRDQGAAILVLSEDLDELFLLSDRLGALCAGRLSPLENKSKVSLEQLGQWMAGSFEHQENQHAY